MAFDETDIRKVPGAIDELLGLGVMATPAMLIGGKIFVGFDPDEIDKAIEAGCV